ncbi:MAG: archease [Candidatus Omnitrophica bacterium]|nr:archease [Candidatus Omnitrophota bacterium]
MSAKKYEQIEHTADIGLKIFGKDKKTLFINAAQGMFSLIAVRKSAAKKIKTSQEFKVEVQADGLEGLLVSWLSELLTLADIYSIVATRLYVSHLSSKSIQARVSAEPLSDSAYTMKTEIKAVTYHLLKIVKNKTGFQGTVFFDI